jgi:mono/diheme cytochrome c family protein
VDSSLQLDAACDGRDIAPDVSWGFAVSATGRSILLAAVLAAVTGCASGDGTLATVDPEAAPLHPTYDEVFDIVEFNCAPCHGDGGDDAALGAGAELRDDGYGEGEDQDYSTCQGIQEGIEGLRRTVLDEGSMPPGAWPRLTEREKLVIRRWITEGACSPCTSPCP